MYTHTLFHLIYLKLAFRQWECFLFSLSSTDLVANVTKENHRINGFFVFETQGRFIEGAAALELAWECSIGDG